MLSGLLKVLQKCLIREVPVLVSVPVKLTDTSQQAPLPQPALSPGHSGREQASSHVHCGCPSALSLHGRTQPARPHSTSCSIFFSPTVQAGMNSIQFLWDLKAMGEESPWTSSDHEVLSYQQMSGRFKQASDVSLFSVPFLIITYVSGGQDMGLPSSESFEDECLQTSSVRTMTKPLLGWLPFKQGSRKGQQAAERTHSSALSTTESRIAQTILLQQLAGR